MQFVRSWWATAAAAVSEVMQEGGREGMRDGGRQGQRQGGSEGGMGV